MKAENTLDFPIRWAWHKIARHYNVQAHKHGFTMSIGYCLLNIDRKEGTPSTKLGPLMGMESRSLTRTLKTMEESGLIERRPDAHDGRMVRLFLTPEGERLRKISRDTVVRLNQVLQQHFSEEELNAFFKTVRKVNQLLEGDIFEPAGRNGSSHASIPLSLDKNPPTSSSE